MRNTHKKVNVWDSINSSKSDTNIVPPWCSLGKVTRRKLVPKCEIQSSYPLRENIWEYLHDGENFKSSKRRRRVGKRKEGGKTKLVGIVFMLLIAGVIAYLWRFSALPGTRNLMDKLISGTKFLSLVYWKPSVSEECCHKMKYLALELSRAEHNLRNTLRLRRVTQIHSVSESNTNIQYIDGAIATMGRETKEWGSRVALWGIIPLWKAAPPPDTVLSLRIPTPADCWPFSGSSGELIIQLPSAQRVTMISIEHVRPDTAQSAPKHFITYGMLANNTVVKVMDNQYQRNGPAKQYFTLGTNHVMRSIIFHILTNHGNVKYTCIYRIHLYKSNKLMGF